MMAVEALNSFGSIKWKGQASDRPTGGAYGWLKSAAGRATGSGLRTRKSLIRLDLVLALFAVGDVYVSLCKKITYAPFSARRRS